MSDLDDEAAEQVRRVFTDGRPASRNGSWGSADSGCRAQTRMTFKDEDFDVQVQVSSDGGDAPRLHVTVERVADGATWRASFTSSCAFPAAAQRRVARPH